MEFKKNLNFSDSLPISIKPPFGGKSKNHVDLSLDVTKQKFNPGSPPINDFMQRLNARRLFYQAK
jgi:hypothetical protein